MKKETKKAMGISILIVIIILTLLFIWLFFIIKYSPERHVKEIEVCEGVTIGTINANAGLCNNGCILYKGEFVPYDTLKYLIEVCDEQDALSEVSE
jgi:hypothetical protein